MRIFQSLIVFTKEGDHFVQQVTKTGIVRPILYHNWTFFCSQSFNNTWFRNLILHFGVRCYYSVCNTAMTVRITSLRTEPEQWIQLASNNLVLFRNPLAGIIPDHGELGGERLKSVQPGIIRLKKVNYGSQRWSLRTLEFQGREGLLKTTCCHWTDPDLKELKQTRDHGREKFSWNFDHTREKLYRNRRRPK